MTRFVFITGGVVSSLGKGIASAALAALLQARGYRVRLRKLVRKAAGRLAKRFGALGLERPSSSGVEFLGHGAHPRSQHFEFRRAAALRLLGDGPPPADQPGPSHQFIERTAELTAQVSGHA